MTDSPPLIELRQVHRHFRTSEETPAIDVLKGVDLIVNDGDQLSVVGRSGSGKSTLLHLMGGLDLADEGAVLIEGADWSRLSEPERAARRRDTVGFVFQNHHLLPHLDLLANVLVPVLAGGKVTPADTDRAKELLHHVGLGDRLTHRPGQCSGGECQRVAVVRALINRPRLLLADEPTGALDEASASSLIDLFLELNQRENVAVVMVTHANALAARLTTTLRMQDGRLASA